MARFASLTTLNVNDALPDAWVDEVKAFHDYMIAPGADLASSATINITSDWHGITGTTTIDNINDAAGASVGQNVTLWLKTGGPIALRHQGGGSGNLRMIGAGDISLSLNETIQFVWDGTVWRECSENRATLNLPVGGQVLFVDTGIYRQASGGNLAVVGSLWVSSSTIVSAGGGGTLYIGGGLDAGIGRYAASMLKTSNPSNAARGKMIEGGVNVSVANGTTTTPDCDRLFHRIGVTSGGAGTLTIAAPQTSGVVGNLDSNSSSILFIRIVNTSGGTCTLSWNAIYVAGGTNFTLPGSVANGASTLLGFAWSPADVKWLIVAFS